MLQRSEMTDVNPYQGDIMDNFDWYVKEQEWYLRDKLGDKLYELLEEIEDERRNKALEYL